MGDGYCKLNLGLIAMFLSVTGKSDMDAMPAPKLNGRQLWC